MLSVFQVSRLDSSLRLQVSRISLIFWRILRSQKTDFFSENPTGWLNLALPWSVMIYLSTECHIIPLTSLNAFVYKGFNAQSYKLMDGRLVGNL